MRILFLLIILNFPLINFGQEVTYSNAQKFNFKNSQFEIVGQTKSYIFTYRATKEGYFLDGYDDLMHHKVSVNLDFLPQKVVNTQFITQSNHITVLFQSNEGGNLVQFAAKLDNDGKLLNRPKKIMEVKLGWLSNKQDYFMTATSEDKTKTVIIGVGLKGGKLECKSILINENLEILNTQTNTFTQGNGFQIEEIKLDNNGNIYFVTSLKSGTKDAIGIAHIFIIDFASKQLNQITLPLGDIYLSSLTLKIDNQNQLCYLGGFYSAKKNGNNDGITFGIISTNSFKLSKFTFKEFDEQSKLQTGAKNIKRAFNDFKVKDIIIKNNGHFLLISEQYEMYLKNAYNSFGYGYYSYYGMFGNPTVREFIYGDIAIMDCNDLGGIAWMEYIRKTQYSQEDYGMFSSYGFLNTGGSLVFLYNDFSSQSSALRLAAIDTDGSLQTSLLDNPAKSYDWVPRWAQQISINSFIVPILKRNELLFAKVQF